MSQVIFTKNQEEVMSFILEQASKEEGRNAVISGSGGVGKALPDDTIIPTLKGFMRLDQIQVGDYIFGADGKPTKVEGVYLQGVKKCYGLKFSDGRTARSCDEHLWPIITSKGKIHIKPLKDLMNDYKGIDNRGYNRYKYQFLSNGAKPIQFPEQKLPIDPYIMGLFLGDGCCLEEMLTISSKDEEIPRAIAIALDTTYKRSSLKNYSWYFHGYTSSRFFAKTPEVKQYSYDKSIPEMYMIGGVEQRKALLQGLFDTDGSARRERNGIRFTSTSEKMIKQVQLLVWSLGIHCGNPIIDKRAKKYTVGTCYEIVINGPKEILEGLFRLERKKEIIRTSPDTKTRFDKNTLREITELQPCPMRCLKVDAKDHLFLTENFIPTHNTTLLCELIARLLSEGYKVAAGAMTGKATSVLRTKIFNSLRGRNIDFPKQNLRIDTISKLTKKSTAYGMTEDGETLYSNTWVDPESFDYDVLFIDELSMVPHFVSEWWQRTRAKVFGFGDECQLPEVTTEETKRELSGFKHDLKIPEVKFVSGYGIKVLKGMAHLRLTEVLRSVGDITKLCNELRDFNMSRGELISTLKEWSNKSPDIEYTKSLKELERGEDWQIICYTNKLCQSINNELAKDKENKYPTPDDKILLKDNLNPLGLYNGDTLLFKDLLSRIANRNYKKKEDAEKLYICLKWQGRMPRHDGNQFEQTFFRNYVEFKRQSDIINHRRVAAIPRMIKESGRAPGVVEQWRKRIAELQTEGTPDSAIINTILDEIDEEDRSLAQSIVDNFEPLPRLYVIDADYGYAITTHKSQGSEYEKVCYMLEKFDRPLIYTGISRAKNKVKIINLTKEG